MATVTGLISFFGLKVPLSFSEEVSFTPRVHNISWSIIVKTAIYSIPFSGYMLTTIGIPINPTFPNTVIARYNCRCSPWRWNTFPDKVPRISRHTYITTAIPRMDNEEKNDFRSTPFTVLIKIITGSDSLITTFEMISRFSRVSTFVRIRITPVIM